MTDATDPADTGRAATSESSDEQLDDAFGRLEVALERVRSLEEADPDPDLVAGNGAEPQENRAIRRARARGARGDAAAISGDLASAREGVSAALEQARRSTAASREQRRRAAALSDSSPSRLAPVLERAARGLLERGEEESLDYTLRLVVRGAVVALAGATRAGITLVELGGTIAPHAPSDALVAELDGLQNSLGEGPCLDAVREDATVVGHDMAVAHDRWPRFAVAASERGIGSIMSFPLVDRGSGNTGALNVYADRAGAFDEAAVEAGMLFASHAALALHGARRTAQLNDALRSRDVIGQAKGILMERFGLTEDRAFAMLISSSQDTNMKLRTVAEWVVTEAAGQRS